MRACLGGWCTLREGCAHYLVGDGTPSERLCEQGQDGVRDGYPLREIKAVGTWEKVGPFPFRPATPFDGLVVA